MNTYNNGYYDQNYSYQLYMARQNERRLLSKNARTLGILLLIYELLQFISGYVFQVLFVRSKSGELMLSRAEMSDFFSNNLHYIDTTFEMAYSATVIGASFIILMVVAKAMFRIDLKSIYHTEKSHARTVIVCMPAVMLVNLAISLIIGIVTMYLSSNGIILPEADFSYSDASASAFFFQIFYGVIMAPIVEETLYRGLTIHLLKPYGKGMAVIISSMIFGLMHGNVSQAVNGFCFALVMGTITVYSNSIIPTICIHMINNALAQIPDISDVIGSDMLYEVYLALMITCLVLGLLVIFVYHKKIRLPKDDGCVLAKGERYKAVMLSVPMIVYWCYIAYIFIDSFIWANY